MEETVENLCPIQMLVLAFPGNEFRGEILPELDRLKRDGLVRILDLLVVRKDSTGNVMVTTGSDLDFEEATALGSYLGGLAALEAGLAGDDFDRSAIAGAAELADGHILDEQDVFRVTRALRENTTAAVVLVEHVWMRPLLDAVFRANGIELANEWVRPESLLSIVPVDDETPVDDEP
jgi:uncharacterized membrane protein